MSHGAFGYQKIFGEEEFFAAGLVHIPVGAQKSAKNSRDNAYVSWQCIWEVGTELIVVCEQAFHVFQGCVKVLVHKHQFVIAEGGQFMVPRGKPHRDVLTSRSTRLTLPRFPGNVYSITNISQQEVKIFFSQARRLKPSEAKAAEGGDSQLDGVGQDIEGQSEEEQDMDGEVNPSSEAA